MKRRMFAAAACLVLAAACTSLSGAPTTGSQAAADANAPPDACGAAEFRTLIGQPQTSVPVSSLPQGTRVICHECAVTMDYREDRLNFWLDAEGKVARVTCG